MRFVFFLAGLSAFANGPYPVPSFTDSQRTAKLLAAMPAVDQLFRDYAASEKVPGLVWGVVIDGRLLHSGATGVQSRTTQAPVTPNTVFRIASMTKSFTALAILKLRDEGKLSLEDPVANWIPAFARMDLPTRDSAPIRIRQLLSHSAGLPEDNPWGDQQLGATEAELDKWLGAGIPFSTPPDTRYEYSNYAFGLLGRIVAKAAGVPYENYVQSQILNKLGMSASTFEFATVPSATRATGYRLKPDGTFEEEQPLPHGVFGAMGGLLTNANDLGKYVAFHLNAWPPRDEADPGPVRRSSVREMSHLWTPANLNATPAAASHSGYGYGLSIRSDCRFQHIVGHGGGLPGFGSYMQWLPEYGVGIFAMASLTYSGPAKTIGQAWDVLLKTGGLQRRQLPPSPALTAMREPLWQLWRQWDDAKAKQIAAMNLFLDAPIPQRRAVIAKLQSEAGACTAAGPVIPENWLRGQFNLSCANGTVGVFYTLAPTQPPLIQHLEFRRLQSPQMRMVAPTGPPAGVACAQ
jgi:CubicO group peptidase (beta-lactamase class C family)